MKALRIGFFVLLVIIMGLWVFRQAITRQLIRQRAVTNFTRSASQWLTDGRLHIVFLGTGTSAPEADHAQSGLAFIADGQMILIDAGSGVVRNAEIMKLPLHKLTALFYTHLHPDHIDDTAALLDACWRNGCRHKINIIGPMGTIQAVNGFAAAAQAHAATVKTGVTSTEQLAFKPLGAQYNLSADTLQVLYGAGLQLAAFRVEHVPGEPAFGYQLRWKGRLITISGDTRKNENVLRYARGADLLIHEAFNKTVVDEALATVDQIQPQSRDMLKIQQARQTQAYHTTPVEAAQLAQQAGVERLVFTHIIPPLGQGVARWLVAEPLFLEGVKQVYTGEVEIAHDGLELSFDPKIVASFYPD